MAREAPGLAGGSDVSRLELSIVSPVYQAATIVPDLVAEIRANVSELSDRFEILLVEDGSRDESWQAICRECALDSRVKGIKLSRNFGQHYAITAGLAASSGEWVVVMDCDLQDRPDQIPGLYWLARSGFDSVCARRASRTDTAIKRYSSKLFYRIFSYLTGIQQDSSIANFGIYNRKVITAILSMEDTSRYFPAMVQWVGYRRTTLDVLHAPRRAGASSYNLRRLLRLALNTVVSFSEKPLRLVVLAGLSISGISFLIGFLFVIGQLLGLISVIGYTSLIVSIWLTTGMIIFVLGIVGLYVGKSYEGIKRRPLYIVETTLNRDADG